MTDQAAASPAPPSPAAPATSLLQAVVSTALLAGWIAWQFGWIAAVAGVIGVFVHEYGHVLAINALGYGPGRIQIIPFFGGAATPRRPPASEFHGVLIALAGPVFGLLATAPFFVAVAVTGDPRWLGGALFIAAMNLLNLAPVAPLDGSKAFGPLLARIHPWLERGAVVAIAAAVLFWAVQTRQFLLGTVAVFGALGALRGGRMRPWATPLTAGQWLGGLAAYLLALVACAIAAVFVANGGAAFRS
jgi:Zn-dependent protease